MAFFLARCALCVGGVAVAAAGLGPLAPGLDESRDAAANAGRACLESAACLRAAAAMGSAAAMAGAAPGTPTGRAADPPSPRPRRAGGRRPPGRP